MNIRRNNRTKLEIFLIILLVVLFLAFFAFLLLSIILLIDKSKEPCMTEHCISAASDIIDHIDYGTAPCDDFYDFVCGTWKKNTRIPDDTQIVTIFETLQNELVQKLRDLLNVPLNYKSPLFERNLKIFYASCMDMDKINEKDSEPLISLLDKFGGWPIIKEDWNEANVDLTHMITDVNILVDNVIFRVAVTINLTDSTKYALSVVQGTFTFEKGIYMGTHKHKIVALKALIGNVSLGLKQVKDVEALRRDVDDILLFETKLANISVNRVGMGTFEDSTVGKTSELVGTKVINMEKHIISIFKAAGVKLDRNRKLVLNDIDYFKQLSKILESTPKRTIVNYMIWKFVEKSVYSISQRFRDLVNPFFKVTVGVSEIIPLWQICVGKIEYHFPTAIGRLYIEKHFNPRAKETALEMIGNIKETFLSLIDDASWMSSEAISAAKEKVHAIEDNIGYPEYLFNNTHIDEDFQFHVMMVKDDFFGNIIRTNGLMRTQNFQLLDKQIDRSQWLVMPATINAVYIVNYNKIAFPAAVLQAPLYHEENPKYLNFGGIGSIIGHEITHGFDNMGSRFDKNGNMRNWWPDHDRLMFGQRTSCMVEQYNNYKVEEINETLNGVHTLGENIADNTGLKAAYLAYQKWVQKNGREKSLPGLKFTPDQLFFIQFGQNWCNVARLEYLYNTVNIDTHSPGKQRVIGSVTNLKEFSEAFNCPAGSLMNPNKKCEVW